MWHIFYCQLDMSVSKQEDSSTNTTLEAFYFPKEIDNKKTIFQQTPLNQLGFWGEKNGWPMQPIVLKVICHWQQESELQEEAEIIFSFHASN